MAGGWIGSVIWCSSYPELAYWTTWNGFRLVHCQAYTCSGARFGQTIFLNGEIIAWDKLLVSKTRFTLTVHYFPPRYSQASEIVQPVLFLQESCSVLFSSSHCSKSFHSVLLWALVISFLWRLQVKSSIDLGMRSSQAPCICTCRG